MHSLVTIGALTESVPLALPRVGSGWQRNIKNTLAARGRGYRLHPGAGTVRQRPNHSVAISSAHFHPLSWTSPFSRSWRQRNQEPWAEVRQRAASTAAYHQMPRGGKIVSCFGRVGRIDFLLSVAGGEGDSRVTLQMFSPHLSVKTPWTSESFGRDLSKLNPPRFMR